MIIPNDEHAPHADDMGNFKNALRKSDVLVYFAFPPGTTGGGLIAQSYYELAEMTGGEMFDVINQPSTRLLRLYLEQLALELRHQYTIGFTPKASNDGKYHHINVKVTSPTTAPPQLRHLKIRNRKGYLAG